MMKMVSGPIIEQIQIFEFYFDTEIDRLGGIRIEFEIETSRNSENQRHWTSDIDQPSSQLYKFKSQF